MSRRRAVNFCQDKTLQPAIIWYNNLLRGFDIRITIETTADRTGKAFFLGFQA